MSLRDFLTFTAKLVGQSSDYALHWINHYVFRAGIAKFYVFKVFPLDSDLPVVIQTRTECHLGKTYCAQYRDMRSGISTGFP